MVDGKKRGETTRYGGIEPINTFNLFLESDDDEHDDNKNEEEKACRFTPLVSLVFQVSKVW